MTPDQIIATVLALLAAEPAATGFPVIAAGGASPAFPVRTEASRRTLPATEVEGLEAVVAGLKFPWLAKSDFVDRSSYDPCAFIDPALPPPDFHEAVTGDVPMLLLCGYNDTQTATEEALLAAADLSRAITLGFPETRQGALVFSQCAKDIGLAFVERPGDPLDAGCTDTLRPKWVLPPP